jgi:NADH:ubiquinone oxidoreductase subunit E
MNEEEFRSVFAQFHGEEGELISILLRIQERLGYISEESVRHVSHFLKLSENQVYGVASFFLKFRFDEPGETAIRVCMGTACHVHGGSLLADAVGWDLGIAYGKATPDKRFDFQRANCLGSCTLAPVVEINGKILGRVLVTKLKETMRHREEF